MELKTLKELQEHRICNGCADDMRAEAIKQAKFQVLRASQFHDQEIKSHKADLYFEMIYLRCRKCGDKQPKGLYGEEHGKYKWIKYFFNISEEDLK